MTLKDMPKRFRNIILTGMPGSGKSTFGKIYAIYSGRYFLDFDKYFEIVTKKKIAEFYQKEGEEAFRAQEDLVLRKLDKKHNYVIAMGGGTVCTESNFEYARRLGLIVFLDTPLEVLAKRIVNDNTTKLLRPMFSSLNSQEEILAKLKELWDARKEAYERGYIHLNTEFGSLDNLKLQLGLYEKKNAEREQYKEKNPHKFQRSFSSKNARN
ncbi:MAG: shikimate kinase [Bdellovibrionota bacterium]